MPNLDEWIEAQLKKGYTEQQIKKVLAKYGYPPEAAAEVDKIASSSLANQRNPLKKPVSNKFVLTILIIVILFVAWLLAAPFFKQPSKDIMQEQKSDEQLKQEGIQPPIDEDNLIKLKEIEAGKNKETAKEFNNDFCSSLIPENIRGMPVSEYALNYHIDGSFGENVKWIASEQPKEEFSPFEGPQVFFVSGNEFEGCGYKQEIESQGINTELRDKYGLPYLCNAKEVYIIQKIYESYAIMSFYQPESEDKAIALKISIKPVFNNKEQILISMGCEI